MNFSVYDNRTSKIADVQEIALKEAWAKDLVYCDMEGFAITRDGSLILLDECGNYAFCPEDRFTVVLDLHGRPRESVQELFRDWNG